MLVPFQEALLGCFKAASIPNPDVWERCESPIEQILCTAMFRHLKCQAVPGPFDVSRLAQLAEIARDKPAVFLFAQHAIGIYRADFLLVVVDPQRRTSRRLVIECDGKAYHTSEQQMARDSERDDHIADAGYRVVRFSGASIYGDTCGVLSQLKEWLQSAGVKFEHDRIVPDAFTPGLDHRIERQRQRDEYWEAEVFWLDLPDFICDDGEPGWWRDTL